MRQGDTITLLLNFQMNGEDLVQGAYQEMELQINKEGKERALKKLLSNGDIVWQTVQLSNGDTFTGYVVHLGQSETFNIGSSLTCQLRIKKDDEVGSSAQTSINLDSVLSTTVL